MGFCVEVMAGLRRESLGELQHNDEGTMEHGASRSGRPVRACGRSGAGWLWRRIPGIRQRLAVFRPAGGIADLERSA